MPSKAKSASAKAEAVEKVEKEPEFVDPRPDLAVTVITKEPVGPQEKTVVFKDTNGLYAWAHLNADGEPWIHCKGAHESKDAAVAEAGLAFPAWGVEVVKENPWLPKESDEE